MPTASYSSPRVWSFCNALLQLSNTSWASPWSNDPRTSSCSNASMTNCKPYTTLVDTQAKVSSDMGTHVSDPTTYLNQV
jgi:hypothetical protein